MRGIFSYSVQSHRALTNEFKQQLKARNATPKIRKWILWSPFLVFFCSAKHQEMGEMRKIQLVLNVISEVLGICFTSPGLGTHCSRN